MGNILKLNRDLFARSVVGKASQEAKQIRTKLAKRFRHERSKGQARFIVSREVFGSYEMFHVGKVVWFELMRGGGGILQLKVYDKES